MYKPACPLLLTVAITVAGCNSPFYTDRGALAGGLAGTGLGAIDAHLLAASVLERARLWTRDAALSRAAARLGVGHDGAD